MSEIDWKAELRKIEREYDGLPPTPSLARLRAERAAKERQSARAAVVGAVSGAWARLILVGALAASLTWWPYGRACGPGLAAFLGASAMIAIGGFWTAAYTWRHRLAVSHCVAIALFVAGLTVLASETLPRLGYATLPGMARDGWGCARARVSEALH